MPETKFLEVSNFMLQKGGFLPFVRLAYRTIGGLNAAKDNAILIPSWYTGTDADSEMFLCGPNRALNPEKYFIVLTNLLGNGISSSPSNTPAPFDRARFPRITFHDNVRLQHQLVTEELGLKSLRLVTGWSMGAAQTYQWAAQYPDMVRAAAPIAGSARTASFNKVFLLSLRRALELDPSFEDGFYERPPIRGCARSRPSMQGGACRKRSTEPAPTVPSRQRTMSSLSNISGSHSSSAATPTTCFLSYGLGSRGTSAIIRSTRATLRRRLGPYGRGPSSCQSILIDTSLLSMPSTRPSTFRTAPAGS